ncbi:hypothetical protein JWH17_15015 [Desulfobulbus marinus]|nr:hypothetical protein [Desulfogranum marinum]MBM9513705.1 hypothetical protein [Desulfogranum marinum]
MNIWKGLGIVFVFALIITFGSETGEQFNVPWVQHLVPTVEARVGRPLTPVSVAGVGRRTVRRCAVGVYHCSFPRSQPVGNLFGQAGSEMIGFEKSKKASS